MRSLYGGGKRLTGFVPAAPFYSVLGARSGPANQSEALAGSLIPFEVVAIQVPQRHHQIAGNFKRFGGLCSVQICSFSFTIPKMARFAKNQPLNYINIFKTQLPIINHGTCLLIYE